MKSSKTFSSIKELSKSGIVTLVLMSVLAGYLIGQPSETHLNWLRLLLTLVGILFLSSGSSALNQIQERHLDAQMARTANRPLPSGRLSLRLAWTFVVLTLVIGIGILAWLSTPLLVLGVLAVISYNGFYTLWWKKRWAYAAVPGAIPGALPILMGFVSADGNVFNPAGIYLFFILFFWQMPHFWALALRYREDYKQGGFPTLPVTHGLGVTVHQIVIWCLAYVGLIMIAPFFLPVKWIFLIPAVVMSIKVIIELFRFIKAPESEQWLQFFLWVNFSLIIFLASATIDLWSLHWPALHVGFR